MAYIVGIVSQEERRKLETAGWEFEDAPAQLIPEDMPISERGDFKMVWIDASMFEIMTGPEWETPKGG